MSEISKGNPLDQNRSGKVKIKTTNFPMHYHLYGTYRFGEMGVLGAWNGLAKDKVKMQQIIDVNTYTLKAPLLTPITMNRTYIQVPRMAILPNAWDKLFINPKIGQDIDSTAYGTSVKKDNWNYFLEKLKDNINTEVEKIDQPDDFSALKESIGKTIGYFIDAELVFSNGSLCNALGMHFNRNWKDTRSHRTFDETFNYIWSEGLKGVGYIEVINENDNNEKYYVVLNWTGTYNIKEVLDTNPVLDLNQWLEKLRDGETYTISKLWGNTGTALTTLEALGTATQGLNSQNFGIFDIAPYSKPVDIAKIWAYQLACAEFFTNDNVDYIYNAELFRQYIGTLVQYQLQEEGESLTTYTYDYNGQKILPDWLSAQWFIYLDNPDYSEYAHAYFYALFKYNRSLKYKDYFTGARTRPIAIGDTNVDVNDDVVSIIDVVKNIQKQRFLNVVNKIPRDLKGYTKGIFGTDIAPDWHNPLYLTTISESIYGQETENTGEAQLSQPQTRTSTLKNQANKLRLDFKLDRNSIVIGLVWFDIPRAYSKGVKREFADVDRFDWFNPYMQYTGDQEIFMSELDAAAEEGTFGYTGAYMDKKQEYNEAFGGFVDDLKGWTFLDRYISPTDNNGVLENKPIGPDFIRSKPSELDRYYISLSGHSMSTHYHFILDIETHYEANRAMAYNPQILA